MWLQDPEACRKDFETFLADFGTDFPAFRPEMAFPPLTDAMVETIRAYASEVTEPAPALEQLDFQSRIGNCET